MPARISSARPQKPTVQKPLFSATQLKTLKRTVADGFPAAFTARMSQDEADLKGDAKKTFKAFARSGWQGHKEAAPEAFVATLQGRDITVVSLYTGAGIRLGLFDAAGQHLASGTSNDSAGTFSWD